MKASTKHLWFSACVLVLLVGCCLCAADNNARVYRYRGFRGMWAGSSPSSAESLLENFLASWSLDADPFVARVVTPDYDLTKETSPTAVLGKLGNAATVGGDKGRLITVGQQNSALKVAGGVFWVSGWIKQTQAPNGIALTILDKTDFGNGYFARVESDNTVSWAAGNGLTYDSVVSVDPIVLNTWYFFTFQCISGTRISLRLSTESVFGTPVELAFGTFGPNTVRQFRLGGLSDASSHEMLIDEVNMGGKALTESDERWMWNNGVGRTYPFAP